MTKYLRLLNFGGIQILQDCATELCLDRKGNFSLPAEKPVPELYPGPRLYYVFDTVGDAKGEALRRKDQLLEVVDYEGLAKLEVGQPVIYVAGMGKYRCLAKAKVSQKPGSTGCMIFLEELVAHGDKVGVKIREEIVAGARELYLPRK